MFVDVITALIGIGIKGFEEWESFELSSNDTSSRSCTSCDASGEHDL